MTLLHSAAQVVTPTRDGTFRVIENGAVGYEDDRITFVGTTEQALHEYRTDRLENVTGKVLVPGFVDAHTHLIFAGNRCNEFIMRLEGATYQQIASSGGGILSTMHATRMASHEQLKQQALQDLDLMLQHGTTTVEVKSGYGLNMESEIKLLEVANDLAKSAKQDLIVTFLGAHDFPPEVERDEYVRRVISDMLPEVAKRKLAEFCDVFCDRGYYSIEQTRAISLAAMKLGLKIKLHVDELADVGGAELAAELNAVSADHLILANDAGIAKLAAAHVTAVLLPGTSIGLKSGKNAPARRMIDSGVHVALATDFNPGTCYSHSMFFILQLGTLLYHLTAQEALTAVTLNGARAVDRFNSVGSLEPGKQMDCLIFDIPHYGYLFYNLGINRLETVIKRGEVAWSKKTDRS